MNNCYRHLIRRRLSQVLGRATVMAFSMLLVANLAFAQDLEVSGTVTDAFTGETLPGVSVMVVGTTIGTSTDLEGNYSLTAPDPNAQLQYSFVGYETLVVDIDGRSELDIEMEFQEIMGQEVLVTGYTQQRRQDLTGSVGVADMSAMERVAESDVSRQLQGQVSGLTVIQSGQPGDEPEMRIRGVGNFGNVSPLYVVDGIPTGSIGDINPRDIESVQVLKDASAASIYGARASNGVVIITTKQGSAGLTVEFDSYVGWETPGHHGNAYNIATPQEHADLVWKANRNSGITPSSSLYGDGDSPVLPDYIAPAGAMEGEVDHDDYFVNPFYTDDSQLQEFVRITPANQSGTNWFDEIFNTAATVSNNIAVRGGTEDATYSLSVNHHYQEGTLLETKLERYTGRLNTTFDITDNFRIGQNVSYAMWENPTEGSLNEGSALGMVYRQQPIIPVHDIAGNYAGNFGAPLGNASNPVAQLERQSENTTENTRLFGNIFAELDFLGDFTFRTNFGGNYSTGNWSWFNYPQWENAENSITNQYGEGSNEDRSWTWTNTVAYNTTLANVHDISVTVGTEANEDTGSWRQGNRNDYFSFNPDYTNLETGADTPSVAGTSYETALYSYFGRVEYNYDDRYLLSGTIRRDGSSRFLDNQWGTFPAGSVGWRISEESFMRDVTWLNNLQFRAGYGIMGNQLNVSPANAFTLFGGNELSTFYPIGGGPGISQGFSQSRIGNPGARWEEAHNLNIGFNAMMFGGVLEIDADYYQNDVRDLLFDPQLPATAGLASQPYVNVGNVENKGLDASITGRYAVSNDLNFNARLNITTYSNEIVEIAEGIEYFDGTDRRFGGGNPIVRNQVDYPISSFFGYEIEGFWASQDQIDQYNASVPSDADVDEYQEEAAPGRFRYKDVTGDGYISPDDRTILGDPHPDFTYGLNLAMNFKNFDASMFFFGSQGNDVWNQVRWWTDFFPSFQGAKSDIAVNDSWDPNVHYGMENPDVTAPIQENAGSTATNLVPNSYYVEDGSYLRLRSVQIGYSLSPRSLEQIGINRLRVYVQGQNLFTITDYTGPDPAIGNTGTATASTTSFGVDEGAYPASRQFLLGINLEI